MIRFLILMLLAFSAPYLIARLIWAIRGIEKALPVQTLILTGIACALVTLFIVVMFDAQSSSSDGAYHPPTLQDGEVRPGRFEETAPDTTPDDSPGR